MTNQLDTRKSIVTGSIADVAQRAGQSLAQTFVNAECVVLVDTSGSMGSETAAGAAAMTWRARNSRRFRRLCRAKSQC